MCENNTLHMKLKNSPAVNKPFRSLFNNVEVTPESKSSIKPFIKNDCKSQVENTKRKLSPELAFVKKIRFDVENIEIDKNVQIFQNDLEELQKRVKKKQKEIEILRNEIAYCKKNNSADLESEIKQWRSACQDALERLQKDLLNKREQSITMEELLSSLGIPNNLVYYSTENDTFT